MEKPWYEEIKSEENRLYEESVNKIKEAVSRGLSFEEASGLISVEDVLLKSRMLDDALKVLIAEMHFVGKKPLKELAKILKLPAGKLEEAKKQMLEDVEKTAINKFKSKIFQKGTI